MIAYSRPKRSDLYTRFIYPDLYLFIYPDLYDLYIGYARVNCVKTIPFTAAHTYMTNIWQYPPGGWSTKQWMMQHKQQPKP